MYACTCMYVCIYVCTMYVHVCMYVCMLCYVMDVCYVCMCVYVCVYVCMYVCMYVHVHVMLVEFIVNLCILLGAWLKFYKDFILNLHSTLCFIPSRTVHTIPSDNSVISVPLVTTAMLRLERLATVVSVPALFPFPPTSE